MAVGAEPSWRAPLLAMAVALGVHGAAAVVLLTVDPARFAARERPVEMDVVEPSPPPPAVRDEPSPPPPKPPERRVVLAPPPRDEPPPPTALPPPNQEPPPAAPPATAAVPVFGVTMDSVVAGNSAMAVPVGNTVATGDRRLPPPGPPPALGARDGTPAFTPTADIYISRWPQLVSQVNSADIYPPDARRLGVEGSVTLSVGIDENGDVKEVKVVKVRPPGYKFDEAARGAMLRAKFRAARGSDGKPAPARIKYEYTFTLGE
ncbi:MAG TPA: TonB family protein [Polyangia bacterium]